MGAGFGVGEGVVMIGQIEAAMCRDGVQLMVLQIGKDLDRCPVGAMELIVGISHLVMRETGFQTSLVEALVVCD